MNEIKLLVCSLLFVVLLSVSVRGAITSVSVVDDTVFGTGQKMILIDWTAAYSDYLQLYVSPSQIKSATGYEADRGFSLGMTSGNEYSDYALTFLRQINYVKIIESEYRIFGWSENDIKVWTSQYCLDLDGDGITYYTLNKNFFGVVLQIFCFGRETIAGDIYYISRPRTIFTTTFTFQADGKTAHSLTLSNDVNVKDGLTTRFGNDILIRWKGSLSTQVLPPIPTQIYASRSYAGQVWNLVDETHVTAYSSLVATDGNSYIYKYVKGEMSRVDIESLFNTRAGYIFTRWTGHPDFPKARVTFPALNLMRIDLAEGIYIPSFQVVINGVYYIKVFIPSGKPEITDLALPKLTSDYEGNAVVTVKNIGTGTGDFIVSLTCDKVDVFTTTQIIKGIQPGRTGIATFRIVGRTGERVTTYTCTARARDSVTQVEHTLTKSGTLEARPQCKIGEQVCRMDRGVWKIYSCDGYDFTTLVEACGVGEICVSTKDGYKCVAEEKEEKNDDVAGNIFSGITKWFSGLWGGFKNFFKGDLIMIFWLLLATIGGAITFILMRNIFAKNLDDKVALVIASLVGISAFIFIFLFWWFIIIIIVLYFLVRFLVGRWSK